MSFRSFVRLVVPPSVRRLRWRLIARSIQRREGMLISRLSSLRNRYTGNRCFIVGNGPSLNQMDLEVFAQEYMWCTNRAHMLFDRISWRPQFYTGVDRRVIPDVANELNELRHQLRETLFFWPLEFHKQGLLDDHHRAYWFREKVVDEESYPELVFSSDCSEYVVHPRTVTITAIQLAAYLGFNPIYLIGCDTNYTIPKDTTEVDQQDSEKLTSKSDHDPNHFDPRYFGANRKWHAPHPELMLQHYEAVKRYCDSKKIEVINATVGGMLEIFPRADYLSLMVPSRPNRS